MKKVLLITYYWPPAGGPGVQRVLKFAKYLPQYGWQPIILTVKQGEYIAHDESLFADIPSETIVFKTSSIEPNQFYKRFVGMDQNTILPDAVLTEKDINWKKKVANWIRFNLFIPDAKIGWKPFAVSKGKQIITEEKPDLIFSSSPPPTVHLIAKKLSRLSKIPWVADFRDPWTNIHYYKNQSIKRFTSFLDKKHESKVLNQADRIIVVNNGFFDNTEKFTEFVISNGFDSTDIEPGNKSTKNKKFTIRYMGSFKIRQYVDSFFRILEEISITENKDLVRLEIIGNVDPMVKKEIEKNDIKVEIKFKGYLEHKKALVYSKAADLLLHFIGRSDVSNNLLSGKIFEYLMVKKPILAYGPVGGAVDQLLKSTGAGKLFDYEDKIGAREYLFSVQKDWKNNTSCLKFNQDEINKYERKALTKSLVNHFEEIL